MATTYKAAFGNPAAHKQVVTSLLPSLSPDTSNDAALAAALAEEKQTSTYPRLSEHSPPQAQTAKGRPTSPSHVQLDFNHTLGSVHNRQDASLQPLTQRPDDARRHHSRSFSDGAYSQAQTHTPALPQQVTDEVLATRLQRVELEALSDATGEALTSLMFPALLTATPSSRERALTATLSHAPSIRATPKPVPVPPAAPAAAPAGPAVSADRERLSATLAQYDLVERQVAGDGNCQFRALSDQLYGTPEHHGPVRAAVVATLRSRPQQYAGYVLGPYDEYCASMARPGTWGDHVTLQAAADTFGMRVVVLTSFPSSPVVSVEPETPAPQSATRTLYLSFWAEVHYNSLYPASEPPPPSPPPRDASSSPTPGSKPRKVLGSRTLGKVVTRVAHGAKSAGHSVAATVSGSPSKR